jgi:lysophospholipase L1-like esterase
MPGFHLPDIAHRLIARLLPRRARAPAQVVFLGDSITREWAIRDRAFFRAGWLPRGVPGDTTKQLLARFASDVIALRPAVVHIMGGTNDLWHGDPGPAAQAALANLAAIVTLASEHGIRVVLASAPPVSRAGANLLRDPDLLPVLNAGIVALCRSAGIVHVDYARSLADEQGALRLRFTTDGIHISKAGYRAMRQQARDAIEAALRG